MALITYQQAVDHLKQNGVLDVGSPPVEDADLVAKIEEASARVLLFLNRPGEWDVTTVDDPEFMIVQSLVKKVLGWLYRYRGDDADMPGIETILNMDSAGMLKDRIIA